MSVEKEINSQVTHASYECTVTVDCAVFGFQDNELKLLLAKRSLEPFKDKWLLPGGIVHEDESVEEAVDSVLFNLTNIKGIHHQQVRCFSRVDRHPLKRVITICFYALVKPENHKTIAKKYISEVQWFPIQEIPELAIDHRDLTQAALQLLRRNLEEQLLFGELLPDKFTLKELQDLYESLLDQKLDRRNFRKKILQMGNLVRTGEKKKGHKGGPELYMLEQQAG